MGNSILLYVATILMGVAVVTFTYFGITGWTEKDRFRRAMRQARGFSLESQREDNLSKGFADRVILPIMKGATPFIRRNAPSGYVDRVREKLIQLGHPTADAVDRFMAVRLFSLLVIPFAFFLFFFTGIPGAVFGRFSLVVFFMLTIITVAGPDAYLNNRVAARKLLIIQQLPDILDLLTISVEAGLGFEQAIDRVVVNVPGPLSDEMSRMLGETRSGMTRAEAMRALDARVNLPDVKGFVMAVLQADKFGVSIGRVLRSQSEDMRIKRRQIAQEKAQKAPVKMMIPMVLFVLPVLFLVVLGPAALRIAANLGDL